MSENEGYVYKYELHCHCSLCSACGRSLPAEMAKAYYDAGYAGMVLTDHFLLGNTAVDRSLPWEEKVTQYYNAYLQAKAWAQENARAGGREFTVLFGIEHLYKNGKEVLTYGIDLNFLLSNPDLHLKPLPEYAAIVHEHGGFLSHAHPYRHASYIDQSLKPEFDHVDGVEVFNFYTADEDNDSAAAYALEHGLRPTSGGDEHILNGEAVGMAGIAAKKPLRTNEDLVALLRSGDYKLIIKGEIK